MRYTELDSDLEQLWQERAQRIRPRLPAALPLTVGDGRCPHTCERGECAFMAHVSGLMILPRGEDEAVMYLRSRRMGANRLGAISMVDGAQAVDPSNTTSPWGTPMLLTGGPWEEIAVNAAVTTHDPVQVLSGADKWLIRNVHDADAAWRRLWLA